MKILTCPLNGPRNISEFACGGEVKSMPGTDADQALWADYVFTEGNRAGVVFEWWFHVPSAYWFIAERNTLTDEVLRTMSVDAFMAEGHGK